MAEPFTTEMGRADRPSRLHGAWWALILLAVLVAGWEFRQVTVVVASALFWVGVWLLGWMVVLAVVVGVAWAISELLDEDWD